jgi:ribosomal protein S24E
LEETVKKNNKLLHRTEYVVRVKTKGETIKKKEFLEEIVKKFNVKPELIVINKVTTHFKSDINDVDFYVYENKEVLEKLTSKHIMARKKKLDGNEEKESPKPTEEKEKKE